MLLFWILLTVVVCFFLYLYMIMPNTSRRSKILPYLKRDYAHRGLHDSSRLIPENSMPAFREAVKQNLAIELDIHLTRDGKVVVFHDESLSGSAMPKGQLRIPRLIRYSTCIFPELRSICHFFQMSFAMSMGVFIF